MARVKITSETPVIVGHRRLLPGEVHEVTQPILQAAIVAYGDGAFLVLDAPTAVEIETKGQTDDNDAPSPSDDAPATEAPAVDEAPASTSKRKRA